MGRQDKPRAVLGIDAAWTATGSSGVALIREMDFGWATVAVVPSYQAFLDLADGIAFDWAARPVAGIPDPARLVSAARTLLGSDGDLACIAVDMPLATTQITRRREADDIVSRRFGRMGCATHSPNADRPGDISVRLRDGFRAVGFPLATGATAPGTPGHLLEVYPGPAVLRLLGVDRRVAYKVGKARRYWPTATTDERRAGLGQSWRRIVTALSLRIDGLDRSLPSTSTLDTARALKAYEDALDALVCAWIGSTYLAGATAYGDGTAAIWIPS